MTDKIKNALVQGGMVQAGDVVIAAISGGADSVAMTHALFLLAPQLGFALRAAHVNHGLRTAAGEDEAYVRSFCTQLGIPLDTTTLTPPAHADEAWARQQRYAFFASLAQKYGAKIATAHTQNDDAETVLFRLARGTNVRGTAGIPAVRGCFIRPLLQVSRAEVEAYCTQNNLAYVTDETNETDHYMRNVVRHHALPALQQVNPRAVEAISRYAQEMAQLRDYVEQQAQALLQSAAISGGWQVQVLAAAPPVVLKTALTQLTAQYTSPHHQYTQLLQTAILQGSGGVQLNNTVRFSVQNGLLVQDAPTAATQPSSGMEEWCLPLAEGTYSLPQGGTLQVVIRKECINSLKKEKRGLNSFADYGKINNSSHFRTRRTGDTYASTRRGVTKSVKKWFSEAHLSPQQRDSLPLLAEGNRILWMPQAGFCRGLAPTETTTEVLQINFMPQGEGNHEQ